MRSDPWCNAPDIRTAYSNPAAALDSVGEIPFKYKSYVCVPEVVTPRSTIASAIFHKCPPWALSARITLEFANDGAV